MTHPLAKALLETVEKATGETPCFMDASLDPGVSEKEDELLNKLVAGDSLTDYERENVLSSIQVYRSSFDAFFSKATAARMVGLAHEEEMIKRLKGES